MIRNLPFLLLVLAPAFSLAGLEYEATLLKLEAPPGSSETTALFRFTNTSQRTVKIERVESSCGCLSAESDKRIIEPGDSGVIEAVFSTQGKTGLFEKTITVQTNALMRSRDTLTVHIHVPGIVEVEPKMITWTIGEELTPKRVSFKVLRDEPIFIESVDSSRDNVEVTVETIVPGRHYELVLTPLSAAESTLGVVKIETDCEIRAQRRQMAFFRIDNP